jgi:hypothetical protein
MTLEEKRKRTIKVMGIAIPYYQDCRDCSAELACAFEQFTYNQPCIDCKSTKEYQDKMGKKKEPSMQDMLDVNKPAGVFEGHGRMYITNKKGNIIREEKLRPLPVGRKDWR